MVGSRNCEQGWGGEAGRRWVPFRCTVCRSGMPRAPARVLGGEGRGPERRDRRLYSRSRGSAADTGQSHRARAVRGVIVWEAS